MASNKLEQIAIAQRNTIIPINVYNSDPTQNYKSTHTRALSDNETPINGKGTGVYMDTFNGGSSVDIYGAPNAAGSGRIGNTTFNQYNQSNGYTTPDTSGNIGQVTL